MGLKSVRRETLQEGPMDFARGAAGAVGQKMAGAARNVGGAIASTARDVNAAGQQASAVGNFEKQLQQFAQLLTQRAQLKTQLPQQEAEPEQQAAPEQQQAPAQQQNPFQSKPKYTQGNKNGAPANYGPQLQFNAYLQATHGEQIDEGVWDFVKGAGSAIAGKMKEKINSYANGAGDTFRDIYKAGAKASTEGNARATQQKYDQVGAQIQQIGKNLLSQLKAFGPKGPEVLKAAIAKLPQQVQMRVMSIPQFKAVMQPPLQQQA